jgi:tetratricopeptide (TPR) repeat protein
MLRKKHTILAFLLLAGTAPAQSVPSVAELTSTARELTAQHRDLHAVASRTGEQEQQLARCLTLLEALVARMEQTEGLSVEHYVEVSSPMIYVVPAQGVRVAEAGLKRFPDARFLWDHVGFARFSLAASLPPCAQRTAELQAAEQTFRKALALTPDTFHAHLGIYQVLAALDRCAEALAEFELAMRDEAARAALPEAWRHKVDLLLRCGRAADAVALLTAADAPTETDARILLLRARALAGDLEGVKAASADVGKGAEPRKIVDAADALAYLGKKKEALELLALLPARGTAESVEGRARGLVLQCGAAMVVFWKASSFTPKGPLRAALTKALEHQIKAIDSTKMPPKEADLSSSPVLIAQMLANMPAEPAKDWANRVLQVLSVRAIPGHKPGKFEAMVIEATKAQRIPGEDDLAAVFLAMRGDVGDPECCGVLTGLRALEKLGGAEPGK